MRDRPTEINVRPTRRLRLHSSGSGHCAQVGYAPVMIRFVFAAALILAGLLSEARAQINCTAPEAVCAVAARVFPISSFDPMSSSVLIEPGLLVTNRHVIADSRHAEVYLEDGSRILADVVPSAYDGDLILLRAPSLSSEGRIKIAAATAADQLFTVGADVNRARIRVYAPGHVVLFPATGKPLARLHHTALSQPGNSGGALVNSEGKLVGIVTSGGEGRFEAIPATEIARLKAQSGDEHRLKSDRIGLAYKKCTEALDAANASNQRLAPSHITFMAEQCTSSDNRQLMDLAGQVFGRQRQFDQAIALFERALDQDPNAINSIVAMAITLHLARRYEDEISHLRRLLDIAPADAQILRLAIQAGTWGGDKELAEQAFGLLVEHHPRTAPAARGFMDRPPPRPSQ